MSTKTKQKEETKDDEQSEPIYGRLGNVIATGVDEEYRRIFLHEDISDTSATAVIRALITMEENDADEPIQLFLCSPGGSTWDAWAIYDVLTALNCPVYTIAIGQCMSAAPLLLAAGTKGCRLVGKNCSFMLHETSINLELDKISAYRAFIDSMDKQRVIWTREMANLTKKDAKFWSGMVNGPQETWFTSRDAIKWGMADGYWKGTVPKSEKQKGDA